jgi:hypothetical protein
MSTRWMSPALQGLLEELSHNPDSVLFGTAAGLGPAAQHRLPSSQRVPEHWSGSEPNLKLVEREILRVHREEVGHLVRQLSFALTRRRPGLVQCLEPGLDRLARARALPREDLAAARRELGAPSSNDPLFLPAARLAQATSLDLESPSEAIRLLRQAQRLAPHAWNLQHAAFWMAEIGNFLEANQLGHRANIFAQGEEIAYPCLLIQARSAFALGEHHLAFERYFGLAESRGNPQLFLDAWMAAALGGFEVGRVQAEQALSAAQLSEATIQNWLTAMFSEPAAKALVLKFANGALHDLARIEFEGGRN